eukprot:scaffold32551_cov73-Phaeocystis_antarctica.AAC.3
MDMPRTMMRGRLVGVVEEFARETSAADRWSPSTRRTLSIGSRELAGVANTCRINAANNTYSYRLFRP